MNVNQIINMVMRMILRRILRSGVNAGMDAMGRKMARNGDATPGPDGRKTAARSRQALKLGRKIGRF
ncbi:hypothetical protein [Roseovarius sp.]|uniref:hypothetical protein n=1 Tax=Roseovarius sp. TaxID=1486281 RepID=UPI00260A4342|nr:hypothetical protein [Roseovarius sp.]